MYKASYSDKHLIIDILTEAFDANGSVNYVVRQDQKRVKRIFELMNYSVELCFRFGEVFISDDRKGCALVLYPEKKKTTFKTIFLDLRLVLFSIGIFRISKVLKRDAAIKKNYGSEPIYYLWFIGVKSDAQGKGTGSHLLKELIKESIRTQRTLYLETSMAENVRFYERAGLEVYVKLEQPHPLYLMRGRFFEETV